jgi:hypothetical protein
MARQGRATDTGAEVQTSPLEQDVATANAGAVAAAEVVPAGDPRESALAALVYGNSTPAPVADPAADVIVDDSEILDFGGRSKAVVVISYYNQFVDGLVKSARKGQVVSTDAESLKRGERIGALKKYGE